jgi:hypothetical protein
MGDDLHLFVLDTVATLARPGDLLVTIDRARERSAHPCLFG